MHQKTIYDKKYPTARGRITGYALSLNYRPDFSFLSLALHVHPVYQRVCRAVYESIETTGQIVPGQIINLFQEKEEQKLVAAIFNSDIAGIDDKNAREKALTETVVRIKRYHLDELSRRTQDLAGLQKIIRMKSDLQHLHISL